MSVIGHQHGAPAVSARAERQWRPILLRLAPDALILLVVAGLYLGFVDVTGQGRALVMYDTCRDTAAAWNLRSGAGWQDPTIRDAPAWYPPLSPLVVAQISAWRDTDPLHVYAASRWCVNLLIPLLVYVLARVQWGRVAGVLALACVFTASCWWWTFVAAPMPSIHGVVFLLAGLLAWWAALRGGWTWVVVTGLVQALAIWHHPISAAFLAVTIAGHALLLEGRAAGAEVRGRAQPFVRMLGVGLIAAVLTAPLLWRVLSLPRLNTAPYTYFAVELEQPRYALYAHWPVIIPLGLYGLWHLWRRDPAAWWVIVYWVVGVLGQVSGYLGRWAGWPAPVLVPHEFQWHSQLAFGLAAAVALREIGRRVLAQRPAGGAPVSAVAVAVLVISGVTWALGWRQLPEPEYEFRDAGRLLARHGATAAWLRAHSDINDVCAADIDIGYEVIGGLTGRKCIAVPTGHMSPASDALRRMADLGRLVTARHEAEFCRVARAYGVRYYVVTSDHRDRGRRRLAQRLQWTTLAPVFADPDSGTVVFRVRY